MKNDFTLALLKVLTPIILGALGLLIISQIAFLGQVLGFAGLIIAISLGWWRMASILAMFLMFPIFPVVSLILFGVNIIIYLKGAAK